MQLPVWILGVALRTVSVDTDSIAELSMEGWKHQQDWLFNQV